MPETPPKRATAVLVAVQLPHVGDAQHASDVDELRRLVHTLGLEVVGVVGQRRSRLSPTTVVGEGKLSELCAWTDGDGSIAPIIPSRERAELRRAKQLGGDPEAPVPFVLDGPDSDEPRASVVIVDHELSAQMHRNLERATGAEVLDRTHVIVEIFHRHAHSREARLQVEIARLTYVAPRLRDAGASNDRQRGGIGGKGAGESSLELDRRKVRSRIADLRRELSQIDRTSAARRQGRQGQRRTALVGYTNAGKSSMMRALTDSGVHVADKLFATLDTTVRALRPEVDPRILVSDTVGFIKKLPHELVASFRSTLDEALDAGLLLFVVDASDASFREQLAVTHEVLGDIGAGEAKSKLLLNKCDRLDPEVCEALALEFPDAMLVSAHDRRSVAAVRDLIVESFDGAIEQAELFVPWAAQGVVSRVYDSATVLSERHDERGTHLEVRGPAAALARLHVQLAETA